MPWRDIYLQSAFSLRLKAEFALLSQGSKYDDTSNKQCDMTGITLQDELNATHEVLLRVGMVLSYILTILVNLCLGCTSFFHLST